MEYNVCVCVLFLKISRDFRHRRIFIVIFTIVVFIYSIESEL